MKFAWLFAAFCALFAQPVAAQSWQVLPAGDSDSGPVAVVCPLDDAETGNYFCLSLGCADGGPLHYGLSYAGGAPLAGTDVAIDVDGRLQQVLRFEPVPAGPEMEYIAGFNPKADRALIERLRKGNVATLSLPMAGETLERKIPLRGSGRAIGAVLEACPMPVLPLTDPRAEVLDEITTLCAEMGGEVSVEPGFTRGEDLDGDGKTDMVIDYAAAVCSKMASLYCGSGGCTVGFFLNRDTEFLPIFADVIRGYGVKPGGVLALDLHGSFCGLAGYEACRKVFDISDGSLVLIEELRGDAAIAAMDAELAGPVVEAEATDGAADEVAADEVTAPDPADTAEQTPEPDDAVVFIPDGGDSLSPEDLLESGGAVLRAPDAMPDAGADALGGAKPAPQLDPVPRLVPAPPLVPAPQLAPITDPPAAPPLATVGKGKPVRVRKPQP